MINELLKNSIDECVAHIRETDFCPLGLDDYNLGYIESQLSYLSYYFRLYGSCVEKLPANGLVDGYVVDFGGGQGFLSYFLKRLGFRVIYCDNHPLAVTAARKITHCLGAVPDFFVEGSVDELVSECRVRGLQPRFLISVDVIEHVHDPQQLFRKLYELNPAMCMVFTTVCNPLNVYRRFFLRRMMQGVEQHYFLPMRYEFIRDAVPHFTHREAQVFALSTRGYTYDSIRKAIDEYKACGAFPKPCEGKNTCDPNSGSWIERLLPLKQYRAMAKEAGYHDVSFVSGWYDAEDEADVFLKLRSFANRLLKWAPNVAMLIAPFIYICINNGNQELENIPLGLTCQTPFSEANRKEISSLRFNPIRGCINTNITFPIRFAERCLICATYN